jgi:hypothetical protein
MEIQVQEIQLEAEVRGRVMGAGGVHVCLIGCLPETLSGFPDKFSSTSLSVTEIFPPPGPQKETGRLNRPAKVYISERE